MSAVEREGLDLAEWLRDERLTRCEHTSTDCDRPLVCSPCLRDRFLASSWLADLIATERAAAVDEAMGRVVAAIEALADFGSGSDIVRVAVWRLAVAQASIAATAALAPSTTHEDGATE